MSLNYFDTEENFIMMILRQVVDLQRASSFYDVWADLWTFIRSLFKICF